MEAVAAFAELHEFGHDVVWGGAGDADFLFELDGGGADGSGVYGGACGYREGFDGFVAEINGEGLFGEADFEALRAEKLGIE